MADRPVVNAIRGKAREQQMNDVVDYDSGVEPSKSDDNSYTHDYTNSRSRPEAKDSNADRVNPAAKSRRGGFLDTVKAIITGN